MLDEEEEAVVIVATIGAKFNLVCFVAFVFVALLGLVVDDLVDTISLTDTSGLISTLLFLTKIAYRPHIYTYHFILYTLDI